MTAIEYLSRFVGNNKLFDGLVSIADKYSPSSTFKRARRFAMLNGVDKLKTLGIAKAARKLAIIKRDRSQRDFDRKVDQLKQFGAPQPAQTTSTSQTTQTKPKTKTPSSKTSPAPSQIRNPPSEAEKNLYKFGNYGWLGDHRKRSMSGKIDENWGESDLPLDVFHSCYLFNTKKEREMSEKEKSILNPVLDDDDLRLTTAGNDMLSRLFATKFINAFEEEIEKEMEKEQNRDGDGDGAGDSDDDADPQKGNGDGEEIDADTLEDIANRARKKAKKDTKDAEKITNAFGQLAGDEKGEIFYEKDIDPNPYLDIDELLKQLRKLNIVMKEKEPEITGIPSGVSFGSDLDAVLPSELALPDDLFYYKYATDSLLQHETKAEKEIEPVLILIDKSGSMDDRERMIFSRTVAFLIANKSIRSGADAHLQFFDEYLHPDDPISLKDDKETFLKELLSLRNDGGTSIQGALMNIKNRDLRKVVLITDGEDSVDANAKPDFPLISVFVGGYNGDLEAISDKTFTIDDDITKIVMG